MASNSIPTYADSKLPVLQSKKTGKDVDENIQIEEDAPAAKLKPSGFPLASVEDLPGFKHAEEEKEALSEIEQILKMLQVMHNIYNALKLEYEHGSKFYHTIDIIIFSLPLIIVQTLQGIIPHVVADSRHAKLVTSVLSIFSALLIGIQLKLAWTGSSKKYQGSARAYQHLEVEARTLYLELSTANINNSLSVTEAQNTFSKFIESSKKVEMAVSIEKPQTACFYRHKLEKSFNKGVTYLALAQCQQHDPLFSV